MRFYFYLLFGITLLVYIFQYCFSKILFKDVTKDKLVMQYVNSYCDIAIKEMHQNGIPASIKLSQAMLESRFGQSELSTKANNHFGIKCSKNWEGIRYSVVTNEFDIKKKKMIPRVACFRVFESAESCFHAHSEFIKSGKRYQTLFEKNLMDYKKWAFGLQKLGYATDPEYGRKLIHIIEKYKLYNLDNILPLPLFLIF
jgi:flagellum-specific peptidoglycan hydrolase FlgJ